MISIVCETCGMALRISGEIPEIDSLLGVHSDWYPDRYPCPRCNNKGKMVDAIESLALAALTIYDLSPQEAYAALHGLGLPEERECGPTAVQQAFMQPVKKIDSALVHGANRTVLHSIEFVDGTKMYLGSSGYGAIVYRISKPTSYVQKALQDA